MKSIKHLRRKCKILVVAMVVAMEVTAVPSADDLLKQQLPLVVSIVTML